MAGYKSRIGQYVVYPKTDLWKVIFSFDVKLFRYQNSNQHYVTGYCANSSTLKSYARRHACNACNDQHFDSTGISHRSLALLTLWYFDRYIQKPMSCRLFIYPRLYRIFQPSTGKTNIPWRTANSHSSTSGRDTAWRRPCRPCHHPCHPYRPCRPYHPCRPWGVGSPYLQGITVAPFWRRKLQAWSLNVTKRNLPFFHSLWLVTPRRFKQTHGFLAELISNPHPPKNNGYIKPNKMPTKVMFHQHHRLCESILRSKTRLKCLYTTYPLGN